MYQRIDSDVHRGALRKRGKREMTREEAIINLNTISVAFVDPVTKEQREIIDETFRVAIEALKQEPCDDATLKDIFCMGCEYREQEPKTGHWFVDERPESDREIICSNCEQPIFKYHKMDFDYRPKYCPNCGAKMESEDKE